MIRSYLNYSSYINSAPSQTFGSRAGYDLDKISPDDKVDFRTLAGRKRLYALYRRDPMSWRICNMTAALCVARGFKIIPPSQKSRDVLKQFLVSLHKTDPVNALLNKIASITVDAAWSGQGWRERLYSKQWTQNDDPLKVKGNNIVGLKSIHPMCMDFKRDHSGHILLDEDGQFGCPGEFLGYTETSEDGLNVRDIDKRRICHLTLHNIGDEILGIPILEPLYKTRHRGMSIEDGIAQGAYRHGVPFLDLTVGDDQHPADKEMLDNVSEQAAGSNYMSEFVHPPWIKVNMFEQFSLARSRGMLDPYVELCATGSGFPRSVLTGSGEGTNKATVSVLLNVMQPAVISPLQQKLKLFIEDQLFAPLMAINGMLDEIPYVQWNETFPTDYNIAANVKLLSEVIVEGKQLFSYAEAREMLRLPSAENNTFYSLSKQELSKRKAYEIRIEPG